MREIRIPFMGNHCGQTGRVCDAFARKSVTIDALLLPLDEQRFLGEFRVLDMFHME
jgi:hypothetical protein